jgi:hypothetical protein
MSTSDMAEVMIINEENEPSINRINELCDG